MVDVLVEHNNKFGVYPFILGMFWSDKDKLSKEIKKAISNNTPYSEYEMLTKKEQKELTLPYPSNAHYTQVVWRATAYVGCGESVRQLSDGASCRVQVCRYQPPGNCQVKNGNWQAEAWLDETGCGDPCPTEGCYN